MADRTFLLKIIGDTTGAEKSLGKFGDEAEKQSSKASGAFKAVAAAVSVTAVVGFSKAIVSAASDQEQAVGALNSVFADYADEMNAFGETTAKNLGISQAEFSQLAAVTGSMLKNAGVPLDEVASSTQTLTERAADMAAMFGGTVPDAMNAINSALKGERDPIEKYGISLKQTAVDAKAVELGLTDAEGKVTDYGRAMATQALIMEQSSDAAGTFAKESNTVAGQTAIMSAQFKDLQADLGKKLLPLIVKFTNVLIKLVEFVTKNQGWLIPLAAGIAGIVVGIKAWQVAQAAWIAVTKTATIVQAAFNFVLAANPIGIIVIAIAALIAAFVLLYTKVDWFREAVDEMVDLVVESFQWLWEKIMGIYEWIKDNWPLLLAILAGPFGLAVKAIVDHWETIKRTIQGALDAIKRLVSNVAEWLSRPFVRAWEIVRDLWGRAAGAFRTIIDGVKGAFNGLADFITAPFKAAFENIKWLWNSTVGGFGFSVPGWIPKVGGKSFRIPRMATGGIVTGPTVALLGEAGREAVIPLDRAGGFGNVYNITVNTLKADAETGRVIYESLQSYQKVSGL